jgi:hypothetical protein
MYWTDLGISKIQRVNLDGTGLRDLVATNLRFPRGIVLDEPGGKIYWIDRACRRIPLGASGPPVLPVASVSFLSAGFVPSASADPLLS